VGTYVGRKAATSINMKMKMAEFYLLERIKFKNKNTLILEQSLPTYVLAYSKRPPQAW
jgi:hypothetical protein